LSCSVLREQNKSKGEQKGGTKNMGRKKGQAPRSYVEGNLVNLKDRTPEERREIALKGVEARRKKKEQNMALQNCMRQLLEMKTNKDKQKQVLRSFGFTDEELTNRSLLMVALFQKGLTGDVSAIREITDMMDKLDMFENTGKVTSNVTINLVATGETYQPNEQDEQDIWDAENSTDWMEDEDEEDWGNDIYEG
jgi:hypothetical protein